MTTNQTPEQDDFYGEFFFSVLCVITILMILYVAA